MLKTNQALPEPEELFLDYAERLAHHRTGRKALFLALSALAATPHPDDHWHVVENLLSPIIRRRGGEIFRMRNGDVAAVLRSADRELVERLTLKLRYLFRDDPLVAAEETTGEALLCKWFDLNEAYDAFVALARGIEARLREPEPAAILTESRALPASPDEFRGPRDPRQSPLIRWLMAPPSAPRAMDRLAAASVAARLRADESPTPAFELFEPQPQALFPVGFPDSDLERNPQLAAAFAGLAARRLLIELPAARRPAEPVAIMLSLEILLGTELLTLHRAWALGQWTPITFLAAHEEFLTEPKRYRYVRQMLKELGHRLGLHSVPAELLTERTPADADILALAWQPAFGDGADRRFMRARETLAKGRGEDVLVTGVHSREALSFAQALSAGLVAGTQATRLLGRR